MKKLNELERRIKMKFIFSIILVVIVLGFIVSMLFVLGNSKIKEKVFYLIVAVLMLLCLFGTMYFQSYIGV